MSVHLIISSCCKNRNFMKLAVGSDDQKTIRHGHFGESKYYLVYEILNERIKSRNNWF